MSPLFSLLEEVGLKIVENIQLAVVEDDGTNIVLLQLLKGMPPPY